MWKATPVAIALTLMNAVSLHADCSWDDLMIEEPTAQESVLLQGVKSHDIHTLSEAYGHLIGRELQKQEVQLDLSDVIKGIQNQLAGQPAPMTEQEYQAAAKNIKDRSFQDIASHNLALANAFMSSNARNTGVVELIPGRVQIRVLHQGRGSAVANNDTPIVRFTGRYLDGSLFGSSDETGGPVTIPLAKMIAGFRQGVIGMKEGEKRRIFVHPDMAYGAIREIPPNSLLVFDVEVVRAHGDKAEAHATSEPATQETKEAPQSPHAAVDASQPTLDTAWDLTLDDSSSSDDAFSTQPLVLEPAS